jgi:hypothetical protein
MSKKWKVFLAVIAAAVVLSLGGGAVVLADDPPATTSNAYLAAVATKLGVTEQALTDAMKAARQELASAAIDTALAKAVEKQTITEAEAAAIKEWIAQQPAIGDAGAMKAWWDARPELANPKVYNGLIWTGRFARMWGWCHGNLGIVNGGEFQKKVAEKLGKTEQEVKDAFQAAAQEMKAAAFEKALANAVTSGKLTQEEADQISGWWAQRPAALDKFAPGFGGCGRGGFGGFGGMMRGRGVRGGFGIFQSAPKQQSTPVTQ